MKKITLCLSVLMLASVGAFAQEYYLVNETESTLYVTQGNEYRQVPASGVLPIVADRVIDGFSFSRGIFALPTFSFQPIEITGRSQRSKEDRRYLFVSDEQIPGDQTVNPADLSDVLGGARIDNQYLDWVALDPLIARGRTRAPLGVFADFGSGRESTTLEESLLWGRAGTDLQWIKSVGLASDVLFAGNVYTQIAPGTRIFVYVYEGEADFPAFTLEFPIGNSPSLVLLWIPGSADAIPAGNVVSSGFLFEAQVWREALGEVLADPASARVEIASAGTAGGVWEEFVLAETEFLVLFPE